MQLESSNWATRILKHCWWESKMENRLAFLIKVNIHVHNPSILLLGIYSSEKKLLCSQKNLCVDAFNNLIHNQQKLEIIQIFFGW